MKTLHILLLAAAFSILNFNATHGEEIIHGKKANKHSLQYMVSVQLNSKHICGGFLISPSYVLSAAHCGIKGLTVVIGNQNINPKRKNDLRRYTVKRSHIHPSYKENPLHGSDIMLLKLSEKVSLNNDVKIIKIPSKNQRVEPNSKCLVAGWGATEEKSQVNDLMVTDVPLINITDCKDKWNKRNIHLPANILCAGGYTTESGACQGDSGGPLVCNNLAVGIVSFNYNFNCNYPDVPNVYTDISAYAEWINKVIKEDA